MYSNDLGTALVLLLLIGAIIGGCGTCAGKYLYEHIDVSVEWN